jgi:hypothetical protein
MEVDKDSEEDSRHGSENKGIGHENTGHRNADEESGSKDGDAMLSRVTMPFSSLLPSACILAKRNKSGKEENDKVKMIIGRRAQNASWP